ncbi:MAG: flagellar biosynthesis protein FlhF [Pirellulaceae bacterium]
MQAKTYRARSMQEALDMVLHDLGPQASVLHTRQLSGGLFGWLGGRRIEVTASASVNVPSRLPRTAAAADAFEPVLDGVSSGAVDELPHMPAADSLDYRAKFRADLADPHHDLHSMMEELCLRSDAAPCAARQGVPESLFHLFTDLIDAEMSEELARELVDRVHVNAPDEELDDPSRLEARMTRMIEQEISVCGPIRVTPGRCKVAALVGPTGVGKTTTIAKLAANYRLRERQRVGLITVDTYRIAAVDQLRTYAEIIDLPMEVVSTPREMRRAVDRLSNLDLILLDTAGRSPKDDVRIQELKSMLAEARADEVHLVLSAVAGENALQRTAEKFQQVGVTALMLTKLDEATGLGALLPLMRGSRLPLSYVTNGQNVPDDIAAADRRELARVVMGKQR